MTNYPIGWESITPVHHKRHPLMERAEAIDRFASRGADMALDHIISWDCLEEVEELYDLAATLEKIAGGGVIEFHREHIITLAQQFNSVSTILEA